MKNRNKKVKNWFVVKALFLEGYDLETIKLITNLTENQIRDLFDEFSDIPSELLEELVN